ncbi:Exosome complex component rrp40 [Hondaea fermentalgiana]|uniref:Exosome complex component rrp40 n=1 Tax=Hondaea fermentalgiana TaxID=2315210 RepID=A0A2R5GUQ5_9STRA|nr:Exosome complex component rrp40 [Hondaea fermentalgiana]|eukprot:GBG31634.1 Exosome complex component rrp40 [Hondaea fermentalgiana]
MAGDSTKTADNFLAGLEGEMGGVPANFAEFKPTAVFVGQDVTQELSRFGKQVRTGSGLHQLRDKVVVTQAGVLHFEQPNIYWVEHYDHLYRPRLEDNVIAVVTETYAESYHMDMRCGSMAQLPTLAFDGASKRNRPTYKVGTLVYARVAQVHKDMDPELSCMVLSGPKKDWMTGESLYGELKGGYVFTCSLGLANRLLDERCAILPTIASHVPYEVAVGANGMIWINARRSEEIALICNAVKACEFLPDAQVPALIRDLVKTAALKPKEDAEKGDKN